jgi:uncharacterized protein YbbC (DUF1343 family)
MEKFIKHFLITILLASTTLSCEAQNELKFVTDAYILTGAENIDRYLKILSDKDVGIVANQTSLINETHLVDSLLSLDVKIKKIFSPEHGFRGDKDAGAIIQDGRDAITGLPVISLYGEKKKPSRADLEGLDIIVFDIQDVGARFYTYTSTMTYVMEACADAGIQFLVLDRPNPNGFYVDGPVLEEEFRSFVGLHPVPLVHGLTIGEYALMINGEGWLEGEAVCDLTVIKMEGYDHNMVYELPVRPSPNLPNRDAVYLYPSLCLFEGTIVSIGRGTDFPFQVIGHPEYYLGSYYFIPESRPGASLNPKYEGIGCYGLSLKGYARNLNKNPHHFNLSFLINMYDFFREKEFFNNYFDLLAGNSKLRISIMEGVSEQHIRQSWDDDLREYKRLRKTYLLYPDFE